MSRALLEESLMILGRGGFICKLMQITQIIISVDYCYGKLSGSGAAMLVVG